MKKESTPKHRNQYTPKIIGATDRVRQYLKYKSISKYAFSKKTGLSNKFLDNSSNMGTNNAEIVLHHYPDINIEWLITGVGDMLKDIDNTNEQTNRKYHEKED